MKRYVTSTGGPLIVMEADMFPLWGGILTNSASKVCKNDYEFACRVDKYISLVRLSNFSMLILGDMAMDTAVVRDLSKNSVYILRVMCGETDDEDEFIARNFNKIFTAQAELIDEAVDEVSFRSSRLILADAGESSEFSLGDKYHLFFDIGVTRCRIRTFEYKDNNIHAVVHSFDPS